MPKARTIAFLVATAITSLFDHNDGARAQAQPCRSGEYAHNAYTVCEVDLAKHTVRLYWKRSDGTPYAYLSKLPRALEREAGTLLFATNAGMFDPALKPVGLYVEQGQEPPVGPPWRKHRHFSSSGPRRTSRRNPGRCW
jgi:uncharacterized protein YigE (DUF2233 family)